MVQKARDARLLRALLDLAPPRGVAPAAWRRYVNRAMRPRIQRVLEDLGQPVIGPAEKPGDLDPIPPAQKRERASRPRRAVTIRESLARIIEQADPVLGDTLDERLDTLLVRALTDHPHLRTSQGV